MTVYAITDTKKGEQGLRLLIFKLPARFSTTQSITRPHSDSWASCCSSVTRCFIPIYSL